MKILVVLGTRPNFIKHFALGRACRRHGVDDVRLHTGQHYDINMSDVFFNELDISPPHYFNDLEKLSPANETGAIMSYVERVLYQEKPEVTVVYGDVTSTMAAALASAKLGIPIAHVEAGVRSHNAYNPEEINRRVAEITAHTLFPHIRDSYDALIAEGFPPENVILTGDVVKDSLDMAMEENAIEITNDGYVVVTVHRAENTDHYERLNNICHEMINCPKSIRFPVHPRTRSSLERFRLWEDLNGCDHIELMPPLGYLDSVRLLAAADRVVSDSGGVRREAYILGKPVVSLTNMIWVPAMVKAGWEMVADADPVKIRYGLTDFTPPEDRPEIFGDGRAADKILTSLLERYGGGKYGAKHYPTGIVNPDSLASLAMWQLTRNLPVIERTDSMRQTVSLVIPCFNEEDSLPMLFYRLDNLWKTINANLHRLEYVLVDDGSTDASWEMLANKYETDSRVRLIRNVENLGYGAALKRGLEGATGDIIVTVDADTNYDLLETPALIEMMGEGVDIVTASPFLITGGWNYPVHRFFLSRGVVMLYRFLLKEQAQDIKTFTSCFRAYRRKCLPLVTPEADDFLANAEILVRALVTGLSVRQAPAVIFERKFGKSKLKTIKTIFRHLGFMWRLWRGKITPRPSPPAIN